MEIILLKARLEQTEKTLERLIGKNIISGCVYWVLPPTQTALNTLTTLFAGQMGALTAGLAGAGVDLGSFECQDDEEDEEDLGDGEEDEELELEEEEEEEEDDSEEEEDDEHEDKDSDDDDDISE